jgi:signal transduction histidine kinase
MFNASFKEANILIVDDKQDNIDVLVGLLEVQGYTNIRYTTDPRLVVNLFTTFNPDLILLDLMMPYLTGFQILAQLEEMIPEETYLPVLVLTADITPEAKQRALYGGAYDFLSKPFDLIEVGLRIDNLLFARKQYLQLQAQNAVLEEKVEQRTLELKKLNEELEHRVEERTGQLETANKELEAFAYSISHDLQAPLRHISGFIHLLMESSKCLHSEEDLHYMKIIDGGAKEMSKLINALLSFSRLKRTELKKTTVHSNALVSDVIKFFEPELKNRSVKFVVDKLHDCKGDEQLIKQVWINLLSNAIKYTGKREEAIIEIDSVKKEKEVIFYIKDNGAGLNMQHARKLFGVFQRYHKTTEFEGVGIGLANVKSIITRHGGLCHARGEVDKGATFSFSLPA